MTAIKKIEQRLDALEAELTKLKVTNGKHDTGEPWWKEWFGAFQDDPYFEEAMNLAQARREGKELAPRKKKRRPK
ncbi:MAG: hypothetical protein EXS16_19185 [Gemmataceae bacterium]|nr:hypothetical protein [Gemmataceae bacterium]